MEQAYKKEKSRTQTQIQTKLLANKWKLKSINPEKTTSQYGAQLWGCIRKLSIQNIQRFQNKVLRHGYFPMVHKRYIENYLRIICKVSINHFDVGINLFFHLH